MLFGSVGRCLFTNLDQTFDRYLFKKVTFVGPPAGVSLSFCLCVLMVKMDHCLILAVKPKPVEKILPQNKVR